MCINGHHNRLGDSEASAGMAWMSPKRRGRAQRRVSGKTQLVRGQLNFGLCPAPRRNCHRKNCCSGTPDHPRGQPDNFCGGAHHVGCVKGRRLSSTCEASGETLAIAHLAYKSELRVHESTKVSLLLHIFVAAPTAPAAGPTNCCHCCIAQVRQSVRTPCSSSVVQR